MSARYAPSGAQGPPPAWLVARVEEALATASVEWRKPETGLTPAHRFRVRLADGGGIFVKAATTPETAAMLRNEHLALQVVPQTFRPEPLGWIEDPDEPVLLVEDLTGAHWPASHAGVNWRPGDLDRVVDAIRQLGDCAAPKGFAAAQPPDQHGWSRILRDPGGFLELGLCSPAWLARSGEALAAAEGALDQSGHALVHGDMRSDNICLTDDRVVFVDWSKACRGARAFDLALFLPAAHLEGAPAPQLLWPDGGAWAAVQSAQLSLRALEDLEAPAWLRDVFRRLAKINLDWAAASLDLGPPSG